MLSVTEAKLLVSGPSPLSASLSPDLARLEVRFDRNIAGSQPCSLVFEPATAARIEGKENKLLKLLHYPSFCTKINLLYTNTCSKVYLCSF